MIFNTLPPEAADRWENEFVEIKLNIPKKVLKRMIQDEMNPF